MTTQVDALVKHFRMHRRVCGRIPSRPGSAQLHTVRFHRLLRGRGSAVPHHEQFTSGPLGSGQQFPLKLAAAIVLTIPVAIVFFAFQRYFVRGASEGAVKG